MYSSLWAPQWDCAGLHRRRSRRKQDSLGSKMWHWSKQSRLLTLLTRKKPDDTCFCCFLCWIHCCWAHVHTKEFNEKNGRWFGQRKQVGRVVLIHLFMSIPHDGKMCNALATSCDILGHVMRPGNFMKLLLPSNARCWWPSQCPSPHPPPQTKHRNMLPVVQPSLLPVKTSRIQSYWIDFFIVWYDTLIVVLFRLVP